MQRLDRDVENGHNVSYMTDDARILVVRGSPISSLRNRSSLEIQTIGVNGGFTEQLKFDSHGFMITYRRSSLADFPTFPERLCEPNQESIDNTVARQKQFREAFEPLEEEDQYLAHQRDAFRMLFETEEYARHGFTHKFLATPLEDLSGRRIRDTYENETDPSLRAQVVKHALEYLGSESAKTDPSACVILDTGDTSLITRLKQVQPTETRVRAAATALYYGVKDKQKIDKSS
jgi:hypothetical protein